LTDAEVALFDRQKSGFRTATHVSGDHQRVAGLEIARDGVRSAREDYLRDLNSAWKMDKRREPPDDDDDDDEDDLDRERSDDSRSLADIRPSIAARSRWVASLSDQNLVTGVPRPGARPSMRDTSLPKAEPPDSDTMYEQRKRDLENAWRIGPGPAVVGAGPGWVGPAT
jgi:hypothetical protein